MDENRKNLLNHIQTAVEIELSTIPIYLFTYYSVIRQPDVSSVKDPARAQKISLFANKAGGLIMSVAVEEMLHMALASNIKRSLGGFPHTTGLSPAVYPTGLPHHRPDLTVGLEVLSASQLDKFLEIELPEKKDAPPQPDNWDTIGQFYDYIREQIEKTTTDKDYGPGVYQLGPTAGYYAPNNVDTIYPDASGKPVFPDSKSELSGGLIKVRSKADALAAIQTISHQGEGYPAQDEFDDKAKDETTHYYKYGQLRKEITDFSPEELNLMIYKFQSNPTRKTLTKIRSDVGTFVDLCNAIYTYLFMMTEACYRHQDPVQSEVFDIGMHKGMIFILDKVIGAMRSVVLDASSGLRLSPTFENYAFSLQTSAKAQIIQLFQAVVPQYQPGAQILQRIQDLPDVDVRTGELIHF